MVPPKLSEREKRLIPQHLSEEQRGVYDTLIKITQARARDNKPPLPLVVITDLAKDYDDLSAMVVYKELHRLGLVQLRGVVANLMPAQRRAQFGRGALDALGLPNVPIAMGTTGLPPLKIHDVHDYEFACDFMSRKPITLEGEDLLYRLFKEAMLKGEKMTLLCISSLTDIAQFANKFPNLLRRAISNVVLQGGYFIEDGILEIDPKAANNGFDEDSARSFHTFMQNSRIPSVVYTKNAAYAVTPPLLPQFFHELDKIGNPVGHHLHLVQELQEREFFKQASGPKENFFMPHMDYPWYISARTRWFDVPHKAGESPPTDVDEILGWAKVTEYDALAALGAAGDDVVSELRLICGSEAPGALHRLVGDGSEGYLAVNGPMSVALRALMIGSLEACQQGLDSNPA